MAVVREGKMEGYRKCQRSHRGTQITKAAWL